MKFLRDILREELPFFLATPAILWQIFFLYIPFLMMIVFSFMSFTDSGFQYSLTLSHYLRLLKPVYLKIIISSFSLALLTSGLCLLIGYPVAYFIAIKVRKWRMLLLLLIIIPSWANLIVQVYAWFFLLDPNGILNNLLFAFGMISKPLRTLNTIYAILIGMVYVFLPFMILPIYAVVSKMNKRLLEASSDLGASRTTTFIKIIIPLSMPGIYTGFLLVFIPVFGEFAIPTLLGGSKNAFWGTVIVEKFLVLRDWASGFAFAWSGIVFIILCFFIIFVFSYLYKILTNIKHLQENNGRN